MYFDGSKHVLGSQVNSSAPDLQVGGGSGLGPSLPLPLIRQNGKTESLIVEQPTNLRLLNQRLTDAAVDFTTAHAHEPFFVCEWQRTLLAPLIHAIHPSMPCPVTVIV